MRIYRVRGEESGFTVIQNHVFRDKGLSLKAKGLYCLMWSLPESWDITVAGLVALGMDGKESVTRALQELEARNYMARRMARGDGGLFSGADYDLYEVPLADKPLTENPSTDKPTQLNTIDMCIPTVPVILSSKVTRKERSKNVVPMQDHGFSEFWTFYPKKIGKGAARKAYERIRPDVELRKAILAAIVKAKRSAQWTRDGGQFIPNPATWLNQQRWEDEPEPPGTGPRPNNPTDTANWFFEQGREGDGTTD